MAKDQSERSEDIKTVIEERRKLTSKCQELSETLSDIDFSETFHRNTSKGEFKGPKRNMVNNLLIEISALLSNIGGFCDRESRNQLSAATRLLAAAMIEPLMYTDLKASLPVLTGFVVDFNKRPFKVVGFQIGRFGFKWEKR